VFRFVLEQPLGRLLLGALAFGLGAYSAWLFLQAALDPDDNGTSLIGLINRFGQIVTALAHLALMLEGLRLAFRLPAFFGGSRRDTNEALVAEGLQVPFGVQLVGLVGLVLVVVALSQLWRASFADVRRDWHLGRLGENGKWTLRIGRFGLAARAVVLGVGGALVFSAARSYDPLRAGGIADVLETLGRQFSSDWVLAIVALGLVAFGVFGLVEARYRVIPSR
jgi:hypothetical protein